MLLENGTYRAAVRDVHLYERGEQKRLTAAFKIEADGKELVHREWLELNDGTISEKTIQRMRKCFPAWDGTIEKLDEGHCCRDVEVEIVIENEEDKNEPGKWWTRIKYMNPPGGSGTAELPGRLDRGTLTAKYAARFRAMSGGAPARAPEASPEKKIGPPPSSKPPAAPGKTSTMDECWSAICKLHDGKSRDQIEALWFQLLEKVTPGKDSGDLTPEEFGKLKAEIGEDNLPY